MKPTNEVMIIKKIFDFDILESGHDLKCGYVVEGQVLTTVKSIIENDHYDLFVT